MTGREGGNGGGDEGIGSCGGEDGANTTNDVTLEVLSMFKPRAKEALVRLRNITSRAPVAACAASEEIIQIRRAMRTLAAWMETSTCEESTPACAAKASSNAAM